MRLANQQRLNFLGVMLFIVALQACQTYELKVVTNPPDAEVFILDPRTSSYSKVGTTPLAMEAGNDAKIFSLIDGSDLLGLTVEKKGYVVEHFLIDRAAAPKQTLGLTLKPIADWTNATEVKADIDESVIADRVGVQVQEVMRKVQSRDFAAAEAIIARLLEAYPRAAFLWDVRGSVALLKDDQEEAVRSFQQSLALRPENAETQSALRRLGH